MLKRIAVFFGIKALGLFAKLAIGSVAALVLLGGLPSLSLGGKATRAPKIIQVNDCEPTDQQVTVYRDGRKPEKVQHADCGSDGRF